MDRFVWCIHAEKILDLRWALSKKRAAWVSARSLRRISIKEVHLDM